MQKQLDLTQMGLVEMNSNEMEQVDGGGLLGAIIGFVAGAVVGLVGGGSADINGSPVTGWFATAIAGAIIGAASPL